MREGRDFQLVAALSSTMAIGPLLHRQSRGFSRSNRPRKPGGPGLLFGTIRFRAIDARLVAELTPTSCDFCRRRGVASPLLRHGGLHGDGCFTPSRIVQIRYGRLLVRLRRSVDQRALRKGLEEVVHGGLRRADVARVQRRSDRIQQTRERVGTGARNGCA